MRTLAAWLVLPSLLLLAGCPCGTIKGQLSDGRKVDGIEVCGYIDGTWAQFDVVDTDQFEVFFTPEVTGDSELRVDVYALGMIIPISYAQMSEGATPDLSTYSPYENGGINFTSAEIEVLSTEIIDRDGIEYFRTRLRWDVEYGVDDGSGMYLHLQGTDSMEAMFWDH